MSRYYSCNDFLSDVLGRADKFCRKCAQMTGEGKGTVKGMTLTQK